MSRYDHDDASYVHLTRANYENVQNTKFVRKFVHTFARPVAKLRSNFRCAEPLYYKLPYALDRTCGG